VRLALSLLDEAVRPLALASSGEPPHRIVPVGPDGSFRIDPAPAGEWRLRVGTPAELLRGEMRREVRVRIEAGKPQRIRLEGL
jgi:hypothetical protein